MGTRMKTNLPKVLHPIGGGTILGRVISNLRAAGVKNIVTVVGYKAELIEKHFKGVGKFVVQKELLGSGDAVLRGLDAVEGAEGGVLVTCGDTPLIEGETYRKLIEAYSKDKVSCALLTCDAKDPFAYGRIIRNAEGEVLKITEEKDLSGEEKKIQEINVGTYCFKKDELKKFIKKIEVNEKKKEFYLTDIVEILTCDNKKVLTLECDIEEALGINDRGDLVLANRIMNNKKIDQLLESGVTILSPETTVIDETAVIGKDTVILSNTVIEKDVTVGSNCRIGPFSRLRPGTKLADEVEVGNFVEINRTNVGSRTRVKHHTYLGDTTVGCDVNIGAGTITANYDGKDKHHTIIEDNVSIGVGVTLIAPVKIGAGAKIGAGSVVTKNKDVKPGETVIGVPAKPLHK